MNDRATGLSVATIPALAVMTEDELCHVLQNSIYPGAALASVKLVVGYCKSQGLDPMTKPVHIVQMDVKVGKDANGKDKYEKRDVIMPGIELYRTKATTTGKYLGCSEPEFGPMVELKFIEEVWEDADGGGRAKRKRDAKIQYPEWCRVVVRRLVDGQTCEFTAIEYWTENYATAGNYTDAPNKMWRKRPRGQLAKCTEAQALRKGFPDAIGAQPTAEEMEGKTLDEGNVIDAATGTVTIPGPRAKAAEKPEREPIEGAAHREPDPPAPESEKGAASGDADKPLFPGQVRIIKARLAGAALSGADLKAKFGCEIEALKFGQFEAVQAWIVERGAKVSG